MLQRLVHRLSVGSAAVILFTAVLTLLPSPVLADGPQESQKAFLHSG
jgi:hypothetical protein